MPIAYIKWMAVVWALSLTFLLPVRAHERWSAAERHAAALQIRDLASRFNPFITGPETKPGRVEAYFSAETNPGAASRAVRGGQALFLASVADPDFGVKAVKALDASGLGPAMAFPQDRVSAELSGVLSLLQRGKPR